MPRPSLSCRRCPTCSAAFPPTTRRAAPQALGMGSRMLTLTLALILTPTLTLTLPHPHPHPHPNPNPNPTLPQPYRSLCAVERSLLGRLGHRPSRLGLTLRAHRLARDDAARQPLLRRARRRARARRLPRRPLAGLGAGRGGTRRWLEAVPGRGRCSRALWSSVIAVNSGNCENRPV